MSDATTHIVLAHADGMTRLDFMAPHQQFSRVPGARVTVAEAEGSARAIRALA